LIEHPPRNGKVRQHIRLTFLSTKGDSRDTVRLTVCARPWALWEKKRDACAPVDATEGGTALA
jgi:hypothetical protein